MILKPFDFLWLASFPALMTAGQMLFRHCAQAGRDASLTALVSLLVTMPVFYFTLALYGIATLLWIWLLGRYTLAIAYPFAALAVILVPLFEVLFYKQRLAYSYWVGLSLVIAGILIIVRSRS